MQSNEQQDHDDQLDVQSNVQQDVQSNVQLDIQQALTAQKSQKIDEFFNITPIKRLNCVKEILDFYIIGEDKNKLLLFFLLLGDFHPDLMTTVLYRGDPSSGKSHVVESVLKLFPEKYLYSINSATAAALKYDVELRGKKILFLKEIAEQSEIIEFLKFFYSDNIVHKETVRDTQTNAFSVISHDYDKLGIVTTFSFENIQLDLIDRSWVLNPNAQHSQTKNIIEFLIDNEANLIGRLDNKKIIMDKALFISECIETLDFDFLVYLPYIKVLKKIFPGTNLNERRDVAKIIKLIKIITLWNQKNRKTLIKQGERYLFSEMEDLEIAMNISEDIFIHQIMHVDAIKATILDYIVVNTTEKKKHFKVTELFLELRQLIAISRKTLSRKMNALFYEGYLMREKEGASNVYCLLKDYKTLTEMNLSQYEEEINEVVKDTLNYYLDIHSEENGNTKKKEVD